MKSLLDKLQIAATNLGGCTGSDQWVAGGERLTSYSPTSGEAIADVEMVDLAHYDAIVDQSVESFTQWRSLPAPARGQVVRDLGNRLRDLCEPLGELVTLEMGKIRAEGIGEVQEMIDICDFAVGLSRQLCGSTMHSERPGHRMYEQWHPLGPIGIISAFNFPVAVWSWNAALAAVCGDTMTWKPSPQTPLTAVAVQHICNDIMADHQLTGVFNLAIGSNETVAARMVADRRLPLISFTGSCAVGKQVAEVVSARMGKSLLELGGNNAIIVEADANLELAVRGILFGAVGTAGQRCTSTRRVLVQRSIANELADALVAAYGQVSIGDPMAPDTLMGPLITRQAVETMEQAIENAVRQGGEILCGGQPLPQQAGHFVTPTIIRMPSQTAQVHQETFAPILYLMEYDSLESAIGLQNDVPQGLSSAIFTTRLQTAEKFLAATGSDCGIANVNIGTSGAEIGGAFGGEKDTGGGRESGSDAWKLYMRRQTNTINWSDDLPLAQGIEFG
ncbi:MAG: aldehyde dehydrogenase family protein [Mariniblastus sp.]|nr:aldehyde dehydrogenase family protein [Mariniblastus sp.]